jgi:hypothetical protein
MAIFLFTSQSELTSQTILGANVDPNRYIFSIEKVQLVSVQPLLGSELYDLIYAGAEANTLTGDYLTIYNDYVKPIIKNLALAEYVSISNMRMANGGIFKRSPEGSEIVEKDEIDFFAQKYLSVAQFHIDNFVKFMSNNSIPEYKSSQTYINAEQNIDVFGGWFFGEDNNQTNEY